MVSVPACEVASCTRPAPGMAGLCSKHAHEYDTTGLWPERYCIDCGLVCVPPGELECSDCLDDKDTP